MKHCDSLGSVKKQSRTSGLQKWYSCLNELRSITDGIIFTAVTATATTSTKRKIFNLLEMKKPYEVVSSPDRSNISFVVKKMENDYS